MVDSVTDVIINYKSENLDQTVGGIKQTSVALDGLVVASSSTEKSLASLENKFSSLERRFGTSAATAAQYEKIQKDVNLAVANNPALKDRGDDILAAASLRYQQTLKGTSVAVNELGEAHNKLSTQGQALAHAIRTSVTELALGVPPTQVLTQQFSHLTYAATGEGGLAGALKNVTGVFGNMISPMTVGIAATVGATAAVLALANAYDKVQVSSQRATIGAGARTGTTTSDLNNFAEQNSGSLGTNFTTGLSVKEARGFGEELTKTGDIVISRLHGMSDAVVGFANQTGTSMEQARKALVEVAVDPKKGLEELTKVFGPFDNATREAVEELTRAGDKTGAFQAMIDSLGPTLKTAAENMGIAEKAARGLVNSIAVSPNPTGLEGQLEAQRQRVVGAMNTPTGGRPEDEAAKAAAVEREANAYHKLNEELLKKEAITSKAQNDKLAIDAESADKAIISEINAIDQLKDKIAELNRAKEAGVASKQGGAVDAAALQMAQNQLAALEQSQAQAARYAIEVANISTSWGHVGQSVALQLQAMQNALPVAQAWTEAGKMKAQYEATYLDLLNQGKTAQEATAVASKQEELSKAAAVASAQKLVQSSEDNLDKIRAEGTGMEGVVASSIAYRDAIQSGATAMQANVIAANTLQASLMKAAQAQIQLDNETTAYNAKLMAAQGGSVFNPMTMPRGNLTFTGSPDVGGGPNAIGFGPINLIRMQAEQEKQGIAGLADTAYGTGGISSAMASITSSPNTFGINADLARLEQTATFNPMAFLGPQRSTIDDKISTYDSLTQLQNAQTSDKGTQVSNLQAEMAWLNTLPETIARDQKIVSLQQSIDSLKNSTDANTAATSATLNPLYSQGHGALAIGYYKAAGGLDMMAHGPTSGDQIPFHAMVNGGERITITPPGKSGNDNSRQVINNNNFVFNNATTSNARRSFRQFSQGFGQIAAAGS